LVAIGIRDFLLGAGLTFLVMLLWVNWSFHSFTSDEFALSLRHQGILVKDSVAAAAGRVEL